METKIIAYDVNNEDHVVNKAKIHNDCWHYNYKEFIPEKILSRISMEYCIDIAEKYPDNLFLSVREGTITGFLGIGDNQESEDIGEIFAIYVHPQFQGKKIGYSLILKVLGMLKDKEKIVLTVFADNSRAINFYKKFGFVEIESLEFGKNPSVMTTKMERINNLNK